MQFGNSNYVHYHDNSKHIYLHSPISLVTRNTHSHNEQNYSLTRRCSGTAYSSSSLPCCCEMSHYVVIHCSHARSQQKVLVVPWTFRCLPSGITQCLILFFCEGRCHDDGLI
jgi:hypothetical protein